MKLAIVGSRSFNNYSLFKQVMESLSDKIEEIISGGADGADTLAGRYANENKIPLTIFQPNWDKYKKSAGIIRNKQIVDRAQKVIAFWDGKSPGTKYTIEYAKSQKKDVQIIPFASS